MMTLGDWIPPRKRIAHWLLVLLVAAVGCSSGSRRSPSPASTKVPPRSAEKSAAHSSEAPAHVSKPASSKNPPTIRHDEKQLYLRVVGVHDGDTLNGLDDAKTQHKIRLYGIDTPELSQPFGQASKKALSEKVFGKDIQVVVKDMDRYGRTVGHVFIDGRDVNLEMILEGMAWHYARYDNTPAMIQAEQSARSAKRGLWAEKDPVAPWDWRKSEKERKEASE